MPRASAARSVDVLDLAERQLQEARAERAEGLGVAGAQEAVVALAVVAGCARPRAPSACSTWRASARAGGDDRARRARACAGASGATSG